MYVVNFVTFSKLVASVTPPFPFSGGIRDSRVIPPVAISVTVASTGTVIITPIVTVDRRYLGDGPKLVRELFRVADEMSPTLVFIDEIDAVGSKRYESNSGGTREIQRTMLELLNQLDGFDERGDVKVRHVQNFVVVVVVVFCRGYSDVRICYSDDLKCIVCVVPAGGKHGLLTRGA